MDNITRSLAAPAHKFSTAESKQLLDLVQWSLYSQPRSSRVLASAIPHQSPPAAAMPGSGTRVDTALAFILCTGRPDLKKNGSIISYSGQVLGLPFWRHALTLSETPSHSLSLTVNVSTGFRIRPISRN